MPMDTVAGMPVGLVTERTLSSRENLPSAIRARSLASNSSRKRLRSSLRSMPPNESAHSLMREFSWAFSAEMLTSGILFVSSS